MAEMKIDRFKALPPVCIVTGSEHDVSFERVALSQGLGDDIGATFRIGPRAREKVELSLPFSRDAWERYARSRRLVTLSVIGSVIAFVLGGVLAGELRTPALAAIGLVTWCIPVALFVWSRSIGPVVVGFADVREVTLAIPSDAAARACVELQAEQHERVRERLKARTEQSVAVPPTAAKAVKPLSVARHGRRRPSL